MKKLYLLLASFMFFLGIIVAGLYALPNSALKTKKKLAQVITKQLRESPFERVQELKRWRTELYERQENKTRHYRWTFKKEGLVGIPFDKAFDRYFDSGMVQRRLWPGAAKASRANDRKR